MTLPEALEFDEEEVSATSLQQELDDLDHQMMTIRFESPSLSGPEILCQLADLMDTRNKLFDRLRTARVKKFREDVLSLKLGALQIQAIQSPTISRCTLILQDRRLVSTDEDDGKGKKKKKAQKHPWFETRMEFLHRRKTEVTHELSNLNRQKGLSVQEMAMKKRFEWELEGIKRELGIK
jgi:hypothetical protein